jgi:hypothetical protein
MEKHVITPMHISGDYFYHIRKPKNRTEGQAF